MVVESRARDAPGLDLGYLALFLGLRINEIVMRRMRAAGFHELRESHGYVIQHLIEGQRSVTELARRMEVTQQAASKVVAELVRLGVLDILPAQDRRSKKVRLSDRGWNAVRLGRRIRAQIARRLIKAAGPRAYENAREILSGCLEALGGFGRVRTRRIRPPQ